MPFVSFKLENESLSLFMTALTIWMREWRNMRNGSIQLRLDVLIPIRMIKGLTPVQGMPRVEQLLLGVGNCGRPYIANNHTVGPYV
jgi:hypothetical protein